MVSEGTKSGLACSLSLTKMKASNTGDVVLSSEQLTKCKISTIVVVYATSRLLPRISFLMLNLYP
jgi:hypothetical protein